MFARNKKWMSLFYLFVTISLLLSACATPTPEIIEKVVTQIVQETVKETIIVEGTPQVVEKEVTRIVEREVTKIVEVEKMVTPEPTPAPAWFIPEHADRYGGVLNVVTTENVPSAETCCWTTAITQWMFLLMGETLVAFTEDYQVAPLLAESWTISPDNLTYTFLLRQGLKFHNGDEITAEDVVASVNRYTEYGVRAGYFQEALKSIEAKDKYTVVMQLNKSDGLFLTNLAHLLGDVAIMPKSVILNADGTPKEAGSLAAPDEIIGAGPYKMVRFSPDTLVVFERHEDYQPLPGTERNGVAGPRIPYFDEIRLHVVTEMASAMAGLETGKYDVVPETGNEHFVRYLENPDLGINALQFYPNCGQFLNFSHANTWTSDLKFRQAIAAVLDMEELGLADTGRPDAFRLNPYLWAEESAMYLPDDPIAEELYNEQDIEKGKRLLEETGYNGEEIVYISTPTDVVGEVLADQLKTKLGINVKVELYDWPTIASMRTDDKEGWHLGVSCLQSYQFVPDVVYGYWHSTSKGSIPCFYSSPRMDAVLEKIESAMTREEQEAVYREFQQIFWEDLTKLKMYDTPMRVTVQSDIRGYKGWYRPLFYNVWREK